MRILFDQGTPLPLRKSLVGHQVSTAFEMGWALLRNGELLREAENLFDLIITTDQSLRYQQNLASRRLAILVLMTTNWRRIRPRAAQVVMEVNRIKPGDYIEIAFEP
ncbi:MAG: hypothetical protein WD768_22510 [Phycisphaeraceae bacterium]